MSFSESWESFSVRTKVIITIVGAVLTAIIISQLYTPEDRARDRARIERTKRTGEVEVFGGIIPGVRMVDKNGNPAGPKIIVDEDQWRKYQSRKNREEEPETLH